MDYGKKALELGHKLDTVQKFLEFIQSYIATDANDLAELYTIFFLPHITWGHNFKLIQEMIASCGNEYRITQWLLQLNGVDVMAKPDAYDSERNLIMRKMWEYQGMKDRKEHLTPSQEEFYKANLPVIKAYYAKNAAYWTNK